MLGSWLINRNYSTIFAVLLILLVTTISLSQAQSELINVDDPVKEIQLDEGIKINGADLNNKQIAALATNSGLYLYNDALNLLAQIHSGDNIQSTSWSPDSQQIALAIGGQLEIWDWDESTNILTFQRTFTAEGPVLNVEWSPDGQYIAALFVEHLKLNETAELPVHVDIAHISIWDTVTWEQTLLPELYSVGPDFLLPQRISWNPTQPAWLMIGASHMRIENENLYGNGPLNVNYVVDAANGQTIDMLDLDNTQLRGSVARAWHPDGTRVAFGSTFGQILVVNTLDDTHIGKYSTYDIEPIRYMDWNEDGSLLVADQVVIDVQANIEIGAFAVECGVVTSIWRDWGEYPDPGTILLVERCGRITIQNINGFPNAPTPTNFTPTETPEPSETPEGYELTVSPEPSSSPEPTNAPPPSANAGSDQTLYVNNPDGFGHRINLAIVQRLLRHIMTSHYNYRHPATIFSTPVCNKSRHSIKTAVKLCRSHQK